MHRSGGTYWNTDGKRPGRNGTTEFEVGAGINSLLAL